MVLDSLFNKEVKAYKKANKLYEKGLKTMQKNPPEGVAIVKQSLEEIKNSMQDIKDLSQKFSELLVKIGRTLYEKGEISEASYAYENAIKLNSQNSSAYINYGLLLAYQKNYERGLILVEKALRINRKDATAWEAKAIIYEQMGDIDDALDIYRKLIKMYPDVLRYYDKYLEYRPHDVEILFKKATYLYKIKDYSGCIETLKNVISLNRDHRSAWVYMGAAYTKQNMFEEAIKSFKEALKLDPNDKASWVNLAIIYKKRGEYEDALRAIREAIKIDPSDAKIWYLQASIYMALENYNEALNSINRALSLKEDYKDALILKRTILKNLNLPSEMIDTCKKLIKEGYKDTDLLYDLAKAYYDTKDYDSAMHTCTEILKTTPNHMPSLFLQKEIMKAKERWDYVIPICETILNVEPRNLEALIDMSIAYEKLGKFEAALNFMIRATEIERNNVELWKRRKELAKKLNKPQEVINSSLQVLNMVEDFDTYIDLARAYYTTSRYEEAKNILEKAILIEEDDEAWNLLGMTYYKLGNLEKAMNAFKKAAEIDPEVKKYWSNLGWIMEKLERFEEAIEYFDRALALDPGDIKIWYERGLCLKKLSRLEEALRSFEEALKLNPKFTKALFEKAAVLKMLEHDDEALDALNKLLNMEPTNHAALYLRAEIRMKRKEYEAALKDIENAIKYEKNEKYLELKKAACKEIKDHNCVVATAREILNINRKNLQAWRDFAQAFLKLGKVESAITAYREALEIFPDNDILLYELKDILMKERRFADVIDVCKKILGVKPEDYRNIIDLAKALMNLGKYEEAKDYLLRALDINTNGEAYEMLGDCYYAIGDYKNALKSYKNALDFQSTAELHYKIAKTLTKMDRYKDAARSIRKALKSEKNVKYYLLAAKIYMKADDFDKAKKYAEEAYKLEDSPKTRLILASALYELGEFSDVINILKPLAKEGHPKALRLMGEALEKEERYEDALKIYKKGVEKDPKDVELWMGIGRVSLKLDNLEEAAKAYERAYLIEPENRQICENLAFVYEKMGRLRDALTYIDRALGLDPKDKYLWNTKALLLMKLEKFEDAIKCFDRALEIDPDFEPAIEGKNDCERIIEERNLEKFAREVLIHEYKTGKRVTKKIAFKTLNIPLSYIPKVFAYIKREEPVSIEALDDEHRKKFERASLKIAKALNKIENITLPEIVANTKLDVRSAKRLLSYIERCLSAGFDGKVTPEDERQLKRALDMDLKDFSVLNIMINLGIGVCEAVRVHHLLKELSEEEGEIEVVEESEEEDLSGDEAAPGISPAESDVEEEEEGPEPADDEELFL